jgi:2-polyprenyl-6-methoxyphenol hydroxylase-like FAD-dependent oxidoreductase
MGKEGAMAPSDSPATATGPATHAARTDCIVVGGGPAGMILAYLLARRGIDVTLLEQHRDFERAFRGDTIHASTMAILDDLGLAERVLALPHTEVPYIQVQTASGPLQLGHFDRLPGKFKFLTLMPQSAFLHFLADEAARYPTFHLILGATVTDWVTDNGRVIGVRYRENHDAFELHADLTVAADGRHSRLRELADLPAVMTSPPMDVLWFRLPRHQEDPAGAVGIAKEGRILALLDRGDAWQAGLVIPKGGYEALKAAGLPALKDDLRRMAPMLADRLDGLTDWDQFAFLPVAADRLKRWYLPGLLFIGDAAHAMSPVGGVGINYAIQDAVVTANRLTEPLRRHDVHLSDLRAVQREREWPTRVIQWVQSQAHKRVIAANLGLQPPSRIAGALLPLLKVPAISALPGRLMANGIRSVRWTA